MFCPNCGARNSEADTNCQKCGFNLKEQAGAKFKGTMLMMNNASAMAAELRRSAPPGANPPANPPGNPPVATAEATPKQSMSPESAKLMRAQLKGTMIGVAPPALGANKPPAPGVPGISVPRPSSRPPAPLTPGPLGRQPGPGQVNAPGAGLTRGGGTMIGTGIAPSGASPYAPPGATPYAAPVASSPQLGGSAPDAAALGSEAFAPQGDAAQGFDRTHVSPSGPPVPAQPSWVQQSPNQAQPGPAQALAGTQVMSAFDTFPGQDHALSGTLVAGGASAGPATVNSHQDAQFAPQAGQRTNTPAMGVPAAYSPTEPAPARDGGDTDYLSHYTNPPKASRAMTITLTVLTCGLYYVYQKFMAKNG